MIISDLIKNRINAGYRFNTVCRKQYPKELRKFAISVFYYSPRAYEFIRSQFKHALPAVSTLRLWMSSLDCMPGLTQPSFDFLKQKGEKDMTLCCLMVRHFI
jgi:hypothetical protein